MKFSHLKRIYHPRPFGLGDLLDIKEENFHYLTKVLRLKSSAELRIFNEQVGEFSSIVQAINKNHLIVRVQDNLRLPSPSLSTHLTLGICILKGSKMQEAIDMAVQIGVDEIIPVISNRTQIKTINSNKLSNLIINATEQSERLSLPLISEARSLDTLKLYKGIILFANENESLLNNLQRVYQHQSQILLIIGPEGGFTSSEISMILSWENTISFSLGANVLRAETAAIAALAQIQLLRENN